MQVRSKKWGEVDGLADRPRPERQPRLVEAQRNEVAKWVVDGPDLMAKPEIIA
jgi:hypothetical protein